MANLKTSLKLQYPVDQIQNAYYAFYFQCIKLKLIYYVNLVLHVYTRRHDKPYKIFIFQWVDSQSLDNKHIKRLGKKQLSMSVTQTQFKELLSCTPLYQYFLANNISVQLPDSKIFTDLSPIVKWGAVLIVIFILLLLAPFFIIHILP